MPSVPPHSFFREDNPLLYVLYAGRPGPQVERALADCAPHLPRLRFDVVESEAQALARLSVVADSGPVPDLLLVDCQSPGLNAPAIARTLRGRLGLTVPIVLICDDDGVVATAAQLGLNDCAITRRDDPASLAGVIEDAARQARFRQESSSVRPATTHRQLVLSAGPTVLYACGVDGQSLVPLWVSDNITRVLHFSPAECLAPDWWVSHVHDADRAHVLETWPRLLADGSLLQEYRFRDGQGVVRWLRDHKRLLFDANHQPLAVVGNWDDVTAGHALAERQRLHATALESTRDGVLIADLTGRIISVNPAFSEMTGYTAAEAIGRNPRLLQSGRHDRAFYQAMWASLTQAGHWQGELWNRRADGEIYPQWATLSVVKDEHGQPTHYLGVFTDLSKLKHREEELEHLAHYDPLTDLPNRLLLRSLLQHALERAQRQGGKSAVLVINLDQFKNVNDSLGHALGDELLLGVTARLKARLRHEDVVGRLGADEFVAILEASQDAENAGSIAGDLLAALAPPFVLADGHETYARASIGISVFPQDGKGANDLLRSADVAMHRAKQRGGNQYAFYTGELGHGALQRLEMETALRRALIQGELVLHYQPKLDLASGVIVGGEALLRWQRPGFGLVPPYRFIPLAEETGLIVPIGAWVINETCRQIRAWAEAGQPSVMVAVNVSARQFAGGELEAVLATALRKHAVDPRMLGLELTESMLMAAPEQATERLDALRRVGVAVALDDFGTGYSSLSYLSRFPVDELKIDRSFITHIVSDPKAANIATAVIALAHRMALKVVAEGVETETQLSYLRKNRCDQIQGYLFSAPVPADEFATLVSQGKCLPPTQAHGESHTLLLVDDKPHALSALRRALRAQGYRVLATGCPHEGLNLLAGNDVQVIVAAQRMLPMQGTDFLTRVRLLHPDTVRIVMAGYSELESIVDAVNQGAVYRFLTKPWEENQLRGHIRDAFDYYEAIVRPRTARGGLP
jgi:diguanylate cyclase (GGDEF)-like protein/PAS domain S-box-containing protein